MDKDKKIVYSEPEEYIPKEIRKKYKVGEFAQEDVTKKKCYIHESGCDTHLDYLELDKRDVFVLDGPKKKEYFITLINEHKRKFEIIITAKEYKELSEINPEIYLPRAAEIINSLPSNILELTPYTMVLILPSTAKSFNELQ